MRASVIVPVRDGAAGLAECLAALRGAEAGLIVVDDASRDDSAAVAMRAGALLVRLARPSGAAAARNAGARQATGDVLCFIDADVVVAPDTIARLVSCLEREPGVAAVFGSYDAAPRAPGLVSQYRNLLHHFVHQHGATDAATFWTGCGAVRRSAFEAVGGFDEDPRWRSIEDVELGYRLRAAGHRLRLDPTIQVTHLKRWTLASVLWTDGARRALPWSRLLLARRTPLDHLNLGGVQRASVVLALATAGLVVAAVVFPALGVAAAAALGGLAAVNGRFLRFLADVRGVPFAIASVPLLALHYLESGLCYAGAWALHRLGR